MHDVPSTFKFLPRKLAVLACVLGLAFGANAQTRTMHIAQVLPLSGPLANVGKEIHAISKATLEDFNQEQTRYKFSLNVFDDGNVADKSTELAQAVPKNTLAFLSCFGSVGCLAQQKIVNSKQIPLVGAIAGASPLRGKSAGFSFAARASAADEVKTLLKFCDTTGMSRVSVMIQDDGFGRSYDAELAKLQQQFPALVFNKVLLKPSAPDYKALAAELQKANPNALLLLANAVHSTNLLMAWKEQHQLPFVLNLAGQANSMFASKLKGYTGAAAFVTVTPSPWESRTNVQREYQRIAKAASLPLSYLGFEAYLNATLLINSVTASKAVDATDLANYLELMDKRDLGGFSVSYTGARLGSNFTDLALLRNDGSYKH
jgi:branched-chain amino acid transport system substrate-binding protein